MRKKYIKKLTYSILGIAILSILSLICLKEHRSLRQLNQQYQKLAAQNNKLQSTLTSYKKSANFPNVKIGSKQEETEAIKSLNAIGGLVLPEKIYLIAGKTQRLYYKNMVDAYDPEVFLYSSDKPLAFATFKRRFIALKPGSQDIGEYDFSIMAKTYSGLSVDKKIIKVIVIDPNITSKKEIKILFVGDSLGHQSRFPNAVYNNIKEQKNLKVRYLGTHKPAGALIPHEQYGGWQFKYFTTLYGVDKKNYHATRSPFMFMNTQTNQPEFSISRYISESLHNEKPDFVHIQLGVNDGFSLDANSVDFEKNIDDIINNANTLVNALRTALPNAKISLGTVIPANSSDRAFIESYRAYPQFYSEWRWRQVQIKLTKKMMEAFQSREKDNVYVVPTHLVLDSLDGYSAHIFIPTGVDYELSNAVHPTPEGDKEIGLAIYAQFLSLLS